MVVDAREQRVAAAGDQAQERRLERRSPRKFAATWPCRWSTGGERQPPRGGQRLAGRDADEQRADQARALGDGDRLDVVQRRPGLGQRVVDHGVDELEVVARGDLRHDAAVAVVHALGGDDVGADRRRG